MKEMEHLLILVKVEAYHSWTRKVVISTHDFITCENIIFGANWVKKISQKQIITLYLFLYPLQSNLYTAATQESDEKASHCPRLQYRCKYIQKQKENLVSFQTGCLWQVTLEYSWPVRQVQMYFLHYCPWTVVFFVFCACKGSLYSGIHSSSFDHGYFCSLSFCCCKVEKTLSVTCQSFVAFQSLPHCVTVIYF